MISQAEQDGWFGLIYAPAAGYLQRGADQGDERISLISLTDAGTSTSGA